MEGLTLTRRPALARVRSLEADTVARVLFGLLCLAFAVGFFVYPTYPNYDSYYSLLWGRELLDLQTPGFEGFRVPTEHPLAIAAGAVLSLFGEAGDRLWVALIFASFLWLIWGTYRLGQVAFTPLVGGIAAALVLTRFDFGFLAARGYIDIPYMAIVMWAAVLEARRPRRGVPVLLLLAAAGMLRPEAWVLAGLYWLWLAWPATWRERALYAALAALGPLVWTATDFAVTGDPLFSLLYTSGSAEDLGRQRSLAELPTAIPGFLTLIVKPPVLAAAVAGLGLAVALAPRRAAVPLALLGSGIATFVLIGVAGASVIERYLAIAAVALLIFAGVFLGGFTMLRPGRLRTAWMAASATLVLAGVVFTATQVRLDYFDSELTFRGPGARRPRARAELARRAGGPALRAADRAQPQARARLALDPRRAREPRDPARRPGRAAPGPRRRARRHQPLRDLQARLEQRHRLAAHPVPARGLGAGADGRLLRRVCALLAPPWRCWCSSPSASGCGGSTTACRTCSTPTRTRTSCPARSGCSATR